MKLVFLLTLIAAAALGQSTPVLSQAEIEALEAHVATNPTDLSSQKILSKNYAYYMLGVTAVGKYDHVEAVDPTKAESAFATHARTELASSTNAVLVGEGGQALWGLSFEVFAYYIVHGQAERSSSVIQARKLGVQAMDRAILLDPAGETWRADRIHMIMMRMTFTDDLKVSTPDAYFTMKQDLALITGDTRDALLAEGARLAMEAGELDDAARYAQELLDTAPRGGWNAGNAIFFGNMVLGQVALRRGDKTTAQSRLLASGKTKGSPQLNSFGPNMTLAKELIEAGDHDTPVAFFELCRSFWKMDRGNLDRWSALAALGKVPDFGANLHY